MAQNLWDNGRGHNSIPEKPFFDQIIALEREKEAINEEIKQIYIEVKEADITVGPMRLAVKRYLESDEARLAREAKEAEADRILRAIGPLGEAAVERPQKPRRGPGRPRKSKAETALEEATQHLEGQTNSEEAIDAAPSPYEEFGRA